MKEELRITKEELRITKEELRITKEELRITKEELRIAKADNGKLKTQIAELTHRKGTHNSSIPPSMDINRTTKSLRQQSGKKSGGQKGHEGNTLSFNATPEKVIDHIAAYCKDCGLAYTDTPKFKEKRQIVDIPPIKAFYTEHRVYERTCSCGKCSVSDFPQDVKSPISYGKGVETLCAYLSSRQYISISRIQELFADVFNLPMSEGTIVNKIKSFSKNCLPLYNMIRQRIETSTCIGVDETGCRVNGKLRWMWTWQTNKLTYLAASANRGYDTIAKHFSDGFKNAILVHDCWKPHFNSYAKGHQICLVHILRELQYFIEKKNKWAYHMSMLLYKSMALKKKMLQNPLENYSQQVRQIQKSKDRLIYINTQSKDKKLLALIKRLRKYDQYLFTFLKVMEVPPDNNASEQAIRNVKVKLKVSGLFRTEEGASQYAIIRSVIDSALKNKSNVFNVLSLV